MQSIGITFRVFTEGNVHRTSRHRVYAQIIFVIVRSIAAAQKVVRFDIVDVRVKVDVIIINVNACYMEESATLISVNVKAVSIRLPIH